MRLFLEMSDWDGGGVVWGMVLVWLVLTRETIVGTHVSLVLGRELRRVNNGLPF